jgi:hypothetical protein
MHLDIVEAYEKKSECVKYSPCKQHQSYLAQAHCHHESCL